MSYNQPEGFRDHETIELTPDQLRTIYAAAAKHAFEQNLITLKQARPYLAPANKPLTKNLTDGLETKLD